MEMLTRRLARCTSQFATFYYVSPTDARRHASRASPSMANFLVYVILGVGSVECTMLLLTTWYLVGSCTNAHAARLARYARFSARRVSIFEASMVSRAP